MHSTPWTDTYSPSRTIYLYSSSRFIVYYIWVSSFSSTAGAFSYVSGPILSPARFTSFPRGLTDSRFGYDHRSSSRKDHQRPCTSYTSSFIFHCQLWPGKPFSQLSPHTSSDSTFASQYFTWADRVGGSYRQPESHLDPMLDIKHEKGAEKKM
jgi:hypothetical protein